MEINAQLKYLPNPNVQVVVGEWTADKKVRPYNIYVNLAYEHVNFRLGNQIVRWGKADEISPLDVVNPEDLSLGFTRTRPTEKSPCPWPTWNSYPMRFHCKGSTFPFSRNPFFTITVMIGPILATWKRNTAERSTSSRTNPPNSPRCGLRRAALGHDRSARPGLIYLNHRRTPPRSCHSPFPWPRRPGTKPRSKTWSRRRT
jgi:hypothetical protein